MLPYAMDGKWHPVVRALFGCCLLFVATLRCEAQGNLVPNPSFEVLEDSCPNGCCFNPGFRPLHWYTWQNSSDYFNACAESVWPDSLTDVPRNGWAYQYPFDGEAYVGIYSYQSWDTYREYIGAELLAPLQVGTTYDLSMRVNTALVGNYFAPTGACNNIGLLFTTESNSWLGITGPAFGYRNYAHLYTPTVITDTAGWTLINGSFCADSAYNHIVLGNFFENSGTNTLLLLAGATYTQAYYFIDSVCVTASDEGCGQLGFSEGNAPVGFTAMFSSTPASLALAWPEQHEFSYKVVDLAGKYLQVGVISGENRTVDLEGLASGIYVVTANSGEEFVSSKFVVDR